MLHNDIESKQKLLYIYFRSNFLAQLTVCNVVDLSFIDYFYSNTKVNIYIAWVFDNSTTTLQNIIIDMSCFVPILVNTDDLWLFFVTQNIYLGTVVFATSWDFADAYTMLAINIRYRRLKRQINTNIGLLTI